MTGEPQHKQNCTTRTLRLVISDALTNKDTAKDIYQLISQPDIIDVHNLIFQLEARIIQLQTKLDCRSNSLPFFSHIKKYFKPEMLGIGNINLDQIDQDYIIKPWI